MSTGYKDESNLRKRFSLYCNHCFWNPPQRRGFTVVSDSNRVLCALCVHVSLHVSISRGLLIKACASALLHGPPLSKSALRGIELLVLRPCGGTNVQRGCRVVHNLGKLCFGGFKHHPARTGLRHCEPLQRYRRLPIAVA